MGQVNVPLSKTSPFDKVNQISSSVPQVNPVLSSVPQAQPLLSSVPPVNQLLSSVPQAQQLLSSVPPAQQLLSSVPQAQQLPSRAQHVHRLMSSVQQLKLSTMASLAAPSGPEGIPALDFRGNANDPVDAMFAVELQSLSMQALSRLFVARGGPGLYYVDGRLISVYWGGDGSDQYGSD